MSTKLKAGTATSGAVIDADTAGSLEIQTGSTPTTAISIDASQGVNTVTNTYLATTAGNVGVGTVTATSKLDLYGNFQTYRDGVYIGYVGKGSGVVSGAAASDFGISSTTNIAFGTGASVTERMRIDSSGNLFVGTTTLNGKVNVFNDTNNIYSAATNTAKTGFAWVNNSTTTGNAAYFISNNAATNVGRIECSTSSTTYATSSDYRLKENVVPIANALNKVSALKPVTYVWKTDGSNGEGFIAHELAEVCPNAVVGEKDAVDAEGKPVYQGIDTSFLVATLTASIQELKAIVDAQGEEIKALKGVA